jgi:hypothetical protein
MLHLLYLVFQNVLNSSVFVVLSLLVRFRRWFFRLISFFRSVVRILLWIAAVGLIALIIENDFKNTFLCCLGIHYFFSILRNFSKAVKNLCLFVFNKFSHLLWWLYFRLPQHVDYHMFFIKNRLSGWKTHLRVLYGNVSLEIYIKSLRAFKYVRWRLAYWIYMFVLYVVLDLNRTVEAVTMIYRAIKAPFWNWREWWVQAVLMIVIVCMFTWYFFEVVSGRDIPFHYPYPGTAFRFLCILH